MGWFYCLLACSILVVAGACGADVLPVVVVAWGQGYLRFTVFLFLCLVFADEEEGAVDEGEEGEIKAAASKGAGEEKGAKGAEGVGGRKSGGEKQVATSATTRVKQTEVDSKGAGESTEEKGNKEKRNGSADEAKVVERGEKKVTTTTTKGANDKKAAAEKTAVATKETIEVIDVNVAAEEAVASTAALSTKGSEEKLSTTSVMSEEEKEKEIERRYLEYLGSQVLKESERQRALEEQESEIQARLARLIAGAGKGERVTTTTKESVDLKGSGSSEKESGKQEGKTTDFVATQQPGEEKASANARASCESRGRGNDGEVISVSEVLRLLSEVEEWEEGVEFVFSCV